MEIDKVKLVKELEEECIGCKDLCSYSLQDKILGIFIPPYNILIAPLNDDFLQIHITDILTISKKWKLKLISQTGCIMETLSSKDPINFYWGLSEVIIFTEEGYCDEMTSDIDNILNIILNSSIKKDIQQSTVSNKIVTDSMNKTLFKF